MAVAETATAQGKTGERRTGRTGRAGRTLAAAALLGGAWLAQAQIVADPSAPGHQRPTVLTTGNSSSTHTIPLVNLQTPSAAGVSRNTYSQFDVTGAGVVLNNSRTNVQTQLGGWVQGNPWLATGSARVILNEVPLLFSDDRAILNKWFNQLQLYLRDIKAQHLLIGHLQTKAINLIHFYKTKHHL